MKQTDKKTIWQLKKARYFGVFLSFLLFGTLQAFAAKGTTSTDDEGDVEINTVEQLKAFRDAVNGGNQYSGKTVLLTADLDLSGEANWTPIGNLVAYPGQSFKGTFDGQGHVISNLTTNQTTPKYAVAGLFGSVVDGTIKNVTVKNVNIKSTHYAGGIVAYTSNNPTIENCKVIGGTITSIPELVGSEYDNGDKVGGIMGYATANSTINNCYVEDVTITAYRDLGGIVGFSAGNVTNNSVKNVTINQDNTNAYKDAVTTYGDIIGRDGGAKLENNRVIQCVAQFGDTQYESLKDALDAAEEANTADIVIDLLADATLDITAWDGTKNPLSIGTSDTKSITINGNNHTLTFNQKNSDWNNVATMNDAETKLVLNDMAITNSGYNNGPWNRHDISFNCAVELNNVTSDKALAFKNDATLKNVTVTETADAYSIWVSACGQNVSIDGLTINAARGIKVDAQYVDNPEKVTLEIANATFNTTIKSAILLKSAGGVDVVDKGNNNIANATADTENLVWVDEDEAINYYRYSVTGGATMVPESKESDYIAKVSDAEGKVLGYYKTSLSDAIAAATAGQTVSILKSNTYTLPNLPLNITLEGSVDGVVIKHTNAGNIASIPNGATFKNLTFDLGNNDYHGFQHAGTINMEGCTLNGKLFSYGDMNFTNCEFVQTSDYHMWAYSGNLTYEGCTFTNEQKGKFINVYNENGSIKYTVTANNCKFINKGESSKAALNVKATCGSTLLAFDVFINNCTTEGAFPAESYIASTYVLNSVVQVDDRTADGVDNIQVWQDDVQIYPLAMVAKIGDNYYPTLQAAVDAYSDPAATIEVLTDIDLGTDFVTIDKPVTIDGKGFAITSKAAQAVLVKSETAGSVKITNVSITASVGHGIQVGDDNTANVAKLELDNVTLTVQQRGVRVYEEGTGFGIAIANSTIQSTVADPTTTYTTGNDAMGLSLGTTDNKSYDVTIDNTVIQGFSYCINAVTSGKNLNVTMTGGKTYGRAAVNVWGSNNNFTLDGVEVYGLNNQTGKTEGFACIIENNGAANNVYTIKDSKFKAILSEAAATTAGSSATEQLVDLRGSGSDMKILGSTTYECNYPERGGLVYNEGALETNGLYFDDTTKATFADAFDKAVISDDLDSKYNLYPVEYTSEVLYYWITGSGTAQGVNTEFVTPFEQGWLDNGEFIKVKKDITLDHNIAWSHGEGESFTLTLGDYTITKGDYSVALNKGVTVYTDKQTDIFSAATEGCSIYELTTESGYAYVCGNFVAKVGNDYYETFAEAATAANGKKVITLLADITDSYPMSEGETLRVEKNAYNVTPQAPEGYELSTQISGVVTIYKLKATADMATIADGFYNIKNVGNGKYVKVQGRRTAAVTATDADIKSQPNTVIKVKATNGQVETLRSQGVDIPRYAARAMSYVPDFAKLVVEKLGVSGSGEVLGTTGVDALLEKFNESFDYHLYVEEVEGGVRIYGKTPSMTPVIEFYQANKSNVDYKLAQLESGINDAIATVVDKVGRGSSLKNTFSLHIVWERMGSTLTEPTDEASKVAFLKEVLANETNVWNFAYQSATYYMEMVEGSSYFSQLPAEIANYWNLAKQVRPDFKYYIIQKNGKMDIVSEGNTAIVNNSTDAVWALEPVTELTVNVPEENSRIVGATFDDEGNRTGFTTGYYTTLYTDFGYQLPEGAVALKVTDVKETYVNDTQIDGLGLVQTEEIGDGVAPQTPVLIQSETAGDITITLGDSFGSKVSDNLLHGADWLISEYEINTPTLESFFEILSVVSESTADKYEYLLRRNAGTVNNKYFFGLSIDDLADAYKEKTGNIMGTSPIRTLGKQEGKKLAFNESWDNIKANSAFLFSEEFNPVVFTLLGDVTRDGIIDVSDVTGQVNIIQSRDKKEYNYDYEAADVISDDTFTIDVSDVTGLTNIIQGRTQHPDLPNE